MPNGIAKIVVIGVGGGGGNAVNRMILSNVRVATFIAANTDMTALNMSKAEVKIQLGVELTRGLGAGSDPEKGRKAAEESRDEIKKYIEDADLLFITAGMGGGTGTGAAPVVAEIAKSLGILTIAVVTKPFERFEFGPRMENALNGIEKLKQHVDTLIVVPNERLSRFVPKDLPITKAFQIVDDVLRQAIQGVAEIISTPSLLNLDFADIETIMRDKGTAHIGIGRGKGENRTLDAVRQAVQSPLLETNISGATAIIIYLSGGESLALHEVEEAVGLVRDVVDAKCHVIFGTGIDEELVNEVQVIIIATGFDGRDSKKVTINRQGQAFQDKSKHDEHIRKVLGYEQPQPTPQPRQAEEQAEPPKQDEISKTRMDTPVQKGGLPPFLMRLKRK